MTPNPLEGAELSGFLFLPVGTEVAVYTQPS